VMGDYYSEKYDHLKGLNAERQAQGLEPLSDNEMKWRAFAGGLIATAVETGSEYLPFEAMGYPVTKTFMREAKDLVVRKIAPKFASRFGEFAKKGLLGALKGGGAEFGEEVIAGIGQDVFANWLVNDSEFIEILKRGGIKEEDVEKFANSLAHNLAGTAFSFLAGGFGGSSQSILNTIPSEQEFEGNPQKYLNRFGIKDDVISKFTADGVKFALNKDVNAMKETLNTLVTFQQTTQDGAKRLQAMKAIFLLRNTLHEIAPEIQSPFIQYAQTEGEKNLLNIRVGENIKALKALQAKGENVDKDLQSLQELRGPDGKLTTEGIIKLQNADPMLLAILKGEEINLDEGYRAIVNETIRQYKEKNKGFDADKVGVRVEYNPNERVRAQLINREDAKKKYGIDKDIILINSAFTTPEHITSIMRHEDFGHLFLERTLTEDQRNLLESNYEKFIGKNKEMKSLFDNYIRVYMAEGHSEEDARRMAMFEMTTKFLESEEFQNMVPDSAMGRLTNNVVRWIKEKTGLETDFGRAKNLLIDMYASADGANCPSSTKYE